MEVITGGRRTGRTQKLIRLAAEAEARGEVSYIVCHSHQEATRIFRLADELGLKIGFPLSYEEFLTRKYSGMNIANLYIDNVEYLLQLLSHVQIAAVTILKES